MINPTTPVLVGFGTVTQREDDPRHAVEPLELMMEAARRASADTACPETIGQIDRVLVPRGRWTYGDPARAIARTLGSPNAVTVLSTVGVLQQSLIGDACRRIMAGEIETALVAGGDAGYRILRSTIMGVSVPQLEQPDTPDVVMAPHDELRHKAEIKAGLTMPVGLYAIMESAFRARRGWSVEQHRDRLAALYSRYTKIAADNPDAWNRKALPPEAIRNTSDRNPMQAFPYTKFHCSSWNVDQAAALLFCSVAKAQEAGIPRERWIFPWASTESNYMVAVCARAELDRCPGARIAGEAALSASGTSIDQVDLLDLYSCFPVAVEAYAAELGIDMSRDLTVTGGMPFAGGPYNNYVFQATCRMAALLRGGRGKIGLVSSVSGVLTKQGFGVWSSAPPPASFHFADLTDAVARLSSAREVEEDFVGTGRVVGYSVIFDRSKPPRAVAIADTERGTRVVATSEDPEILSMMQSHECCGMPVSIAGANFGSMGQTVPD